ncbi:hypothetical protein H4Q26_001128 [Puccinia striiformis f. sp. tritici PST-130]|nr:hypothetical protein H4Q26_001128 [Puccinia striiformis f. sp. tritici PST-130]
MPFVKVVKNSAYFSRFQVKYRRRREGKTDYYARKRLITQAKNKYNSPKYRLVVRITNRDIICQVVHAKLQGDFVLAAAYAHELPRYGIKHGLTNWAAAYATGLLGVEEPEGDLVLTEANDEGPRPFKAFLDVGLRRTSTGARIFGAMKGASDGGIFVPHSETDSPLHLRGHVAEYMEALEEEDDERFKKQFSTYLADDIGSADIEEIYTEAHKAIRADPAPKPTDKSKLAEYKKASKQNKPSKIGKEQRAANVKAKVDAYMAASA